MKELDLHGLSHLEVEDRVENFITLNDVPFRIITGNSERMRELVSKMLKKYKIQHYVPVHNPGEIIAID
jgi:hypothetical protein